MGLISNGTTIFDNGAMASGFGGSMTFVSSATASASASIEFTLGSYKEYKFFFVNMHPQNDNTNFEFNLSTDNGSNYNVTKTTTWFYTQHSENDLTAELSYQTDTDLAQSTSYQVLSRNIGADADQNVCGTLQLYNPSSATYVKHFICNFNNSKSNNRTENSYNAGYANTTSALTNIRFQMTGGNIDAGKILMFGIN